MYTLFRLQKSTRKILKINLQSHLFYGLDTLSRGVVQEFASTPLQMLKILKTGLLDFQTYLIETQYIKGNILFSS